MKILSWFFVVLGILGLISIRMLEDQIFYDPFLPYFHEANKHAVFPNFEWAKLIFSYSLRFLLNLFFFYMRRFVIQPLILLVIIPLFYYRKKTITDRF